MERYENYKPSGVTWIGAIPEHWKTVKLGYVSTMIVPMRDKPRDLSGLTPWLRIEDFDGKYVSGSKSQQGVSEETIREMNLKVFPIGTVLCSCSCAMGKAAIVKKPLVTNQTFIGIVPSSKLTSDFLYYIMQASEQYLNSIASGAIQTYLSREEFESLKVSLPDPKEQAAIASYLDDKIAKIDSLIGTKRKLMELLKEERTAIINHAMTKGIDLKARLKHSGIEWIGEIPEHWEVRKLKYLIKEGRTSIKTGPFGSQIRNSDFVVEGPCKVYNQRNVLDDDFDKGENFIEENKFNELKDFEIIEGDVLFTTRGSIGKCAIFPSGKQRGVLHPCLIRVQFNDSKVYKKWIRLFVNQSSLFLDNVMLMSNSTTIEVIYSYNLKEVIIPLPETIKEQKDILAHVEIETQRIDKTISKIEKEIELLHEYRLALISEVVTGKIKVV